MESGGIVVGLQGSRCEWVLGVNEIEGGVIMFWAVDVGFGF